MATAYIRKKMRVLAEKLKKSQKEVKTEPVVKAKGTVKAKVKIDKNKNSKK